jgi:hypothetical protein
MGVLFSCPAFDYDPLEEAAPETETSSSSSGGGPRDPPLLRALGSGKLIIEGSLSFKRRQAAAGSGSGALQVETKISIRAGDAAPYSPLPREVVARARFAGAESPKHEAAALKLQKVYKSFRTRRQLADCAVLVEQSWWVALLLFFWVPRRRWWHCALAMLICLPGCCWTGGSC